MHKNYEADLRGRAYPLTYLLVISDSTHSRHIRNIGRTGLSRLEIMVSQSKGGSITGILIRVALEEILLEARSRPDPWKSGTAKVFDTITRAWMVEAMIFMPESGIDVSHDAYLPTHCRHDEYLMVVFMR
jgi:hypothetical protein